VPTQTALDSATMSGRAACARKSTWRSNGRCFRARIRASNQQAVVTAPSARRPAGMGFKGCAMSSKWSPRLFGRKAASLRHHQESPLSVGSSTSNEIDYWTYSRIVYRQSAGKPSVTAISDCSSAKYGSSPAESGTVDYPRADRQKATRKRFASHFKHDGRP